MLCTLPSAQHIVFKQGDLGQVSPKPTCFFAARLPTLQRHIRLLRGPPGSAPPALPMGPARGGCFNTAQLNIFPEKLNRAIARALVDMVTSAGSGDGASRGPDIPAAGQPVPARVKASGG